MNRLNEKVSLVGVFILFKVKFVQASPSTFLIERFYC